MEVVYDYWGEVGKGGVWYYLLFYLVMSWRLIVGIIKCMISD